MSSIQDKRSARSTNAMLDAAVRLVAEGGFEAMTVAAVGERAGYSRGLVTARFGSKDGLVSAVIDHLTEFWQDATPPLPEDDVTGLDEALSILGGVWALPPTKDNFRHLRALNMLLLQAVGPDQLLAARARDMHALLRGRIEAGLRRGMQDGSVRPDVNPAEEALLVVAAIRGVAHQWILDPADVQPGEALQAFDRATRERLQNR